MDDSTPQRLLDGVMAAVASRVWIADARPAVALARTEGAGDAEAWVRGDPANALAVYRALVPLAWNARAAKAYGLPDVHPADVLAARPDADLATLSRAIGALLGGQHQGVVEIGVEGPDGRMRGARESWVAAGPAGDPLARLVMASLDQSDLLGERAEARRYREQMEMALAGTGTTLFGLDRDLRILWSENAVVLGGRDLAGMKLADAVGADAAEVLGRLYRPVLETGREARETVRLDIEDQTRFFDIYARPRTDADGAIVGLVGLSTEVTAREVLSRKTLEAGRRDTLTGLLNREGLRSALAVARAARGYHAIALGIGGLGDIARLRGPEAEEECLRAVAEALAQACPDGALLGRVSTRGFVVIIEAGSADSARTEAARLRDAVRSPEVRAAEGGAPALRVRVASAPLPVGDGAVLGLDDVFDDVVAALGSVDVPEDSVPGIHPEAARERIRVADAQAVVRGFREARDRGDLVAFAQPIIALDDGRVVGHELLARIRRGGRVIPAGDFVPDLAGAGLLPELDRWMMVEAMRRMSPSSGGAPIKPWVNVCMATFTDPGLVALIDEESAARGVDPSGLVIELIETDPVVDLRSAVVASDALHARGIRLALDDFGTGASGPEHLRDLGIDWLKIDGGFVSRATRSSVDRAVVAGTVAIAEAMGISVVAEWVEDVATRDLMQALGVDAVQGVLMAEPAPEHA